MFNFPSGFLSAQSIDSLERSVIEEANGGWTEAAWQQLQPLRKAQHSQQEAAKALLRIIVRQHVPKKDAADVLLEIAQSHPQDADILAMAGGSLETIRDIDDLNAPPPAHPVFHTVVDSLAALARQHCGTAEEEAILFALATSARMAGRQHDELAENSYRKLAELNPQNSAYHYNLGLFFKTRGRFEEGMICNQTARGLVDEADDAVEWNLGICATGARNGAVALDVWKRMEQKLEIGRFGLPEGTYHQCKAKLAERPLAERGKELDDPGQEETIWIERLSPCHGIIRSVLYGKLGADYGDVILFDGAPVTYHAYGDTKVAVFPHLATLFRQHYQFHDFAGTQQEPRQLANVSSDLEGDTIVYSHSENVQMLCANCWRDPGLDHQHREQVEKFVVTGRIAAPAHVDPVQLLDQLDKAVAKRSGCRLYAPGLCTAAGFETRASVEKRRFDLLTRN